MAQIFRLHKPDIIMFVRRNGTYSKGRSYYDVLRISPNATQKEVKEAFIKLSKEMHPDICGKDGHSDFVKINEAYSVLSKESTRRQYDMNFSYGNARYSNSAYSNSASYRRHQYRDPYETYRSHREWEEHMARGHRVYPNKMSPSVNRKSTFTVWCLFIAVGLMLQSISFHKSMEIRRSMNAHSIEYSRNLRKAREDARNRTPEEEYEFLKKLQNANRR